MRAGILVLGPLVAKYQKSITSFPGGCVLNGNSGRPINFHLNALEKLGMNYQIKKGYIYANSKGKLKGKYIKTLSSKMNQKISIIGQINTKSKSYLLDNRRIPIKYLKYQGYSHIF